MQPENNTFEEFSRYAGEEKLSLSQPKRHVLRMTLLILLLLIAAAAAAGAILRPDLAAELRDRFFCLDRDRPDAGAVCCFFRRRDRRHR